MSELHFTKTLRRTSEVLGSCDGLSFPHNREIGFVLVSFSFRACCASRACGRVEAAWVHDECSYRWASRVLGWTCVRTLFLYFFAIIYDGFVFVDVFVGLDLVFAIYDFKQLPFFVRQYSTC